jgi:hypothetical protein
MLNQARVIQLLYEKTFSMTGLEGNQQAEQDVHEYSKTLERERQNEEEYGEEEEMEGGDQFIDHMEG